MKRLFILTLLIPLISFTFSKIKLERKSMLNDQIELKIPSHFEIMSEEMMQIKYPSAKRPNLVYTNDSGGINVGLSLTENPASPDLIDSYLVSFVELFESTYPSAKWIDKGVLKINGNKVGHFKIITPALDTNIYNHLFFTDLDGKLLLCTFNCTEKDIPDWESIADEIMNSLRIK